MSIEIRNIPLGPGATMPDMIPVDANATINTYRYTIENILSVGSGNTNSGTDSRVEGQNSTSSNTASHAEGQGTTASGAASHSEGTATTASGANAHAEGNNNSANGVSSNAGGSYSHADLYAEWCRGNGSGFKYGSVAWGGSVTGNTPTELFIDGAFASVRFAIPNNSAWNVKISGVAMDATAITASNYIATTLIKNVAGTVSLVGSATVTSPNQNGALAATVLAITADNVNKSLMCTVTGIAAVTLLWMVKAEFEKVF
jgi:hypothetical protein